MSSMVEKVRLFVALLWRQRRLILSMAGREVRLQYVGSSLGFLWTIIQPVVMITVFWFVFSIGFKAKPLGDVPFVVWLAAGLAPWFFFAEIVNGSTSMVVNHAHLIKRTIFFPQILPLIKILAALVTHGVFLTVLLVLILSQQMPLLFSFVQALYYSTCLMALALGIAWATSALNVFLRDVAHLVAVVLQVGFWLTPIFWDIKMMPERIQMFLKLNPVYYIIQGYRDSFITGVPFWNYPLYTLYFWSVTLVVLAGGAAVFKRLKPQFSDVL